MTHVTADSIARSTTAARLALAVTASIVCATSATAQGVRPDPAGPTGTVTLTRTEYDRLLDLANRPPVTPDTAPLPAALTRASLRVTVNGTMANATIQVSGDVLRAGTIKVPLIAGATLLSAAMGDRPLPLMAEGDTHFAMLTGPGSFAATLEAGVPIVVAPGRASFALPVPPAGSATATIDVPGEQTDVRVSPGLVLNRTSANGRTTIDVTLVPGSPAQVWWTNRDTAPAVPAREARTLASLQTLVTIAEAEVRLLTLVDLNVVQGELTNVTVAIPAGYEVTGVTGVTIDGRDQRGNDLTLSLNASQRRHQFLVALERTTGGGSFTYQTAFPSVRAAQRETGEVAVEGTGTLDVTATDIPGLRRMDVREVNPALTSIAHQSLLAAFRYQRTPESTPLLSLDVKRFPDAAVLAAAADRAVATTLVTSEGRALTEVTLWVRNRAQPFVKVTLPPGASMLSAEVGGGAAKPVEGRDGIRVPLLRPGFRPDGAYAVSFVYLHAGTPFAKKGNMQMTLPRMDLPVGIVEWELFVPDRYRADRFDGSMIPGSLVNKLPSDDEGALAGAFSAVNQIALSSGQLAGRVVDPTGAVVPGVTITVTGSGRSRTAVTNADGIYVVDNVPSGPIRVTSQLQGFKTTQRPLVFDQRPRQVDFTMQVGLLAETVSVSADAPLIDTRSTESGVTFRTKDDVTRQRQVNQNDAATAPSANVQNLQRRAVGVLPVRIEVPRAGTSHQFVKPLVVDEELTVSFRYRTR
ncbi:MAG TPA: carboxypeptidase regulatory-like domain-containing protein [Vicinamibacterales bacterium]|nr:carboxypeptidase regulatory-like domain-containing protein [Vicinamibacterales bacterium]